MAVDPRWGWLIFRRMSMKPETFLASLPLKRRTSSRSSRWVRGTETLLRGRKRTYYLNHPGARNIVSNDSSPFLARGRINTIIPGTMSIVYIVAYLQIFWSQLTFSLWKFYFYYFLNIHYLLNIQITDSQLKFKLKLSFSFLFKVKCTWNNNILNINIY